MKIFYTVDDEGAIALGRIVETHVVYEDVEDDAQTGEQFEETTGQTTEVVEETKPEVQPEESSSNEGEVEMTSNDDAVVEMTKETVSEEETAQVEETPAEDITTGEATITYTIPEGDKIQSEVHLDHYVNTGDTPDVENAQVATNEKVSAVSEDEIQQEAPSTASFAESERAELEKLKREKKIALITSYEKSLTPEKKAELEENVDNYSEEELEVELLKEYKSFKEAEEAEEENFSQAVPFAVPEPVKKQTAESSLNDYIRRLLRK